MKLSLSHFPVNRLDTRLDPNTASETDRRQFEDSTEVVHCGSDQNYDTDRRDTKKTERRLEYSHLTPTKPEVVGEKTN